ncbi:MAG: spore coat protein [Bacillota bacterium]|nr:spore coat protein [Bacillota bacterium]
MARLTSKELGLIEDNLRQEQLMVQKFSVYANQATDPEIKSLCQNLRDMHQRHLDTLMKHLNEAATI